MGLGVSSMFKVNHFQVYYLREIAGYAGPRLTCGIMCYIRGAWYDVARWPGGAPERATSLMSNCSADSAAENADAA